MSEPIPESVPTSAKSHRPPAKRAKLTPNSQQSAQVEALFANPEREIHIPDSAVKRSKGLPLPPEIVANVQGSSAGAGSGEFHVYKASRRRENERLRLMDEEVENEKAEQEFRQRRDEARKMDEEKLNKNRAKRDKAKARKMKAKGGNKKGQGGVEVEGPETGSKSGMKRRPGGPVQLPPREHQDVGNDGNVTDDQDEEQSDKDAGVTIHDDD